MAAGSLRSVRPGRDGKASEGRAGPGRPSGAAGRGGGAFLPGGGGGGAGPGGRAERRRVRRRGDGLGAGRRIGLLYRRYPASNGKERGTKGYGGRLVPLWKRGATQRCTSHARFVLRAAAR
ncbi:glycine-rich protein 2 [Numida meleagris]|uniref:glycine-rich protein 2 n=1 Tax=Numida meleagris TaxID=8996 RepID=UPI000B3D83A5|nr:glycine-rich protein 2 [Numida meleagris]